jgi:hypothetical protein
MPKDKSSVSNAQSYQEIGAFWDSHDLGDYWEQTHTADFEVDLQSDITYYAVDNTLSNKLDSIARKRGVSPETLLNLWVQEKLQDEITKAV